MAEKRSFWATIPGVITGLATVVTAILGIRSFAINSGALRPAGLSPSQSASAASPSPVSTSPSFEGGDSAAVLTPTSVEFGDQRIGTPSSPLRVSVVSAGAGPLVIESVDISGAAGAFAVSENTCRPGSSLKPRAKCEIALRFTPASAGSFAAVLSIAHSASDSPGKVPLQGTGVLLKL